MAFGDRHTLLARWHGPVVVTPLHRTTREERARALSPFAAGCLVREVLQDSDIRFSDDVEALARLIGVGSDRRQDVLDAIENGRLVIVPRWSHATARSEVDLCQSKPPEGPASSPALREELAPKPLELDWIEIVIADHAGVPYQGAVSLTLPDGRVVATETNVGGVVRLVGIASGSCLFSLPDLDGADWTSSLDAP